MNNPARGQTALSDIALEEALAKQSLNRSMFLRLWPLLKPIRYFLLATISVELLIVISLFARPWLIGTVIDEGFIKQQQQLLLNQKVLIWASTLLALMWFCRFILAGLSQYLSGIAALKLINDLRLQVFSHLHRLSIHYFDQTKAGRISARVDADVNSLEPLLIQAPPEFLSAILRCLGAGIMLWWIAPSLFWSIAAIVPVLLLATTIFKRISQRNWVITAENRSRFTAHLVETVSGVRIIKQLVQEKDNLRRYQRLLRAFNQSLVFGNIRSSWFAPFTGLLTTVGMAVLLVVGARGVALGDISLGQITASLFYVFIFLAPLQELSDLFERYASGSASAQRIFLLLDTPVQVKDRPQPSKLATIQGEVIFDNVNFSYQKNPANYVIKQLNLHIPAGQVMAIVGPTGHGKSTLVQLLSRFYDVSTGAIYIDGHDLRDIAQHALRQKIGIVLQDNILFNGTILANLQLIAPNCSLSAIRQAGQDLAIDDLIMALPQGYDTPVGALGSHLSHGQRQLICLLRAYLANPAILILDEATSAIDIQTERRIQIALRRLCQGRTAIIIAHRLSTIKDADRIAVIENGQVIEIGNHQQLINQRGFYHRLYQSYEQNYLGNPQTPHVKFSLVT